MEGFFDIVLRLVCGTNVTNIGRTWQWRMATYVSGLGLLEYCSSYFSGPFDKDPLPKTF